MQKLKTKNGITLIALIITIIVMIVLAGVTVAAALNGGLFSKAKAASKQTQIEADRETLQSAIWAAYDEQKNEIDKAKLENNLSGWQVEGTQEYICTSPKGNKFIVNKNGEIEIAESKYVKTIEGLAEGVELVPYEELTGDIKLAAERGRISAVLKETIDGTETIAVVPTGFEVSTIDGENSISNGLVIKDGANEFVWIPYVGIYSEENLGPLSSNHDSQYRLDHYYGEGFFNYSEDFNYDQDRTNIVTSIDKYKGFYVGRYETTIDENGTIGSMRNKTVLTAGDSIPETNNKQCHWYGLYKVQKDMYANNQAVFSTMITSKEWDAIMSFTGYGSGTRPINTYTTTPDKSGSEYKVTTTNTDLSGTAYEEEIDTYTDTYDVSKNIYDLAGNVTEWTLKADFTFDYRYYRGGSYVRSDSDYPASYSNHYYPNNIYDHGRF